MEEVLWTVNLFGYNIPIVKSIIWLWVELILILWISMLLYIKRWTVKIVFEILYEFMYNFFEEILWKKEKKRIKWVITTIFFVIIFANLLWWLWDILAQWIPFLEHYFTPFSADRNWVFAMSSLIVLLTLVIQIINIWPFKFIYEYVPFFWRDYLTMSKSEWMNSFVYYFWYTIIKIFDIIISLFIWLLDIIWTIAKVISLAFRLYGNMFAWTILLVLLTEASWWLMQYLIWIDFPVLLPLILFVQWLLVATIQAFVVALLTSIFVKMVQVEDDTEEEIKNKDVN